MRPKMVKTAREQIGGVDVMLEPTLELRFVQVLVPTEISTVMKFINVLQQKWVPDPANYGLAATNLLDAYEEWHDVPLVNATNTYPS